MNLFYALQTRGHNVSPKIRWGILLAVCCGICLLFSDLFADILLDMFIWTTAPMASRGRNPLRCYISILTCNHCQNVVLGITISVHFHSSLTSRCEALQKMESFALWLPSHILWLSATVLPLLPEHVVAKGGVNCFDDFSFLCASSRLAGRSIILCIALLW